MGGGVGAVGSDGHLEGIVVFDVEILAGRHTHGSVGGKHHDTVMACSQLQLVFSAEHTLADGATQLAFLDFVKLRVGGIYFGTYRGTYHLLSGSDIGGATYNVEGAVAAHIDSGEVQMVRIGMRLAGEHLGYHHMFEASLDGLYFFHPFHLETRECEQVVKFVGCDLTIVDIVFQPGK